MQLTTNQAERILKKLDFDIVKCKHHVRAFLIVDGKRQFAVHYSFGKKAFPGDVPQRFRRSLSLSGDEFNRLVGCSMNRESYISILLEKGVLGAE